MIDSFILGLSSGSVCLVTCGMVMFPYLLAGSAGVKTIAADISLFLFTRFIVYFILATLAWYFGHALFSSGIFGEFLPGIMYVLFAIMLIWYSVGKSKSKKCPAAIVKTVDNRKLIPVLLGVVNSLGFCPALLLIITKGAEQITLGQSYMTFLAFLTGSSLWFLPLPLAGKIRRKKAMETIGILATGLAGIIFIIKGLTIILGGILNE